MDLYRREGRVRLGVLLWVAGALACAGLPVRVLSSTQRPMTPDALKRVWAKTQAELVDLSPRARQEICDTCGHYIQNDDPDRVVAAIRDVIEEAGAR